MTSGVPSPALPRVGPKYKLLGVLGTGRTSVIYEALHEALGCVVALKMLRVELAGDDQIAERFRIEGQTLAQLPHPNIVRVLDRGDTVDGHPFVVLERLWGHTLAAELQRRGVFSPEDAVELAVALLSALGSAHALGVLHRDLNLHNVFLHEEERGRPCLKLLDFGHAKVLVGAAENAPAPLAVPTPPDEQVGTPRTMAPENIQQAEIDTRSDIYSAGVVTYWMLTGRDPFHDALTTDELFRAHVLREPDPPSRWTLSDIPAALDDAVLKALAKQPAARFQSVEAFTVALRDAIRPAAGAGTEESKAELPPPSRKAWPTTRLGAALFVIAIATGVLVLVVSFFPAVLPRFSAAP